MDPHVVGVLSNIGVISFVGLSAYLLLLTGSVSFGQQAFFGIGAYGAGIATAMWGWPLGLALLWAAGAAAVAAVMLGLPTLRLHGLHFAVASLAFAEALRILLEMFHYQVEIDGELVGPAGVEGFRGVRAIFEADIGPIEFLGLIWVVLGGVVLLLFAIERSRLGPILRTIGADDELARVLGIATAPCKLLAAAIAGAIAGLGGGLYVHLTTYVEPRVFDVMLGVHALAYGLIGGLGTAFGPILGALADIGLLESTRWFAGYRMIVFGGIVAMLLIVRPRGLLDETTVNRITRALRRRRVPSGRSHVVNQG